MKNKFIILTLMSIITIGYCDISGVTYFNYSSDDGFGMKRTYFTYKNQISDDLTFTFQTDVGQVGTDNRWTAYLKKAQADWNVSNGVKVSMGLIGMNMFNIQEKTWGNRFVAKSALDTAGWGVASADMGIGMEFSLNLDQSEKNPLIVSLLLTNGEGYTNSDVDDNQKLSVQALYGEKRLDKNSGYNLGMVYSSVDDTENNTERVIGLFGGGAYGNFVAGAEFYVKTDEAGPLNETSSSYKSFYMNYDFSDSLGIFLRKDFNDPDEWFQITETEILMAGFIWTPTKGLAICPNIVDDGEQTFKMNFEFKF